MSTARSRTAFPSGFPRALLVGVLGVGGLGLTAGCGAGVAATTQQIKAPADGVNAMRNGISVLNAIVVAAGEGREGAISMVVANDTAQPDSIASIDAGPAGQVELQGKRDVAARGVLGFGGPSGQAAARIRGLTAKPGESITLTIAMQRAGTLPALRTLVVPAEGDYKGFQPGPNGSGFPSAAVSPVSSVSPSAGFGGATPVAPPAGSPASTGPGSSASAQPSPASPMPGSATPSGG